MVNSETAREYRLIPATALRCLCISPTSMIPTGLYGWHLLMLYRFIFRTCCCSEGHHDMRLEDGILAKGKVNIDVQVGFVEILLNVKKKDITCLFCIVKRP